MAERAANIPHLYTSLRSFGKLNDEWRRGERKLRSELEVFQQRTAQTDQIHCIFGSEERPCEAELSQGWLQVWDDPYRSEETVIFW